MGFSIEDDYLLGALAVLLIVVIILVTRKHTPRKNSAERFTEITPPVGGWDNARAPPDDDTLYGGTVPGWGEDYSSPPF
jgi:hypothetical protein